jgi:5-methylcytosine-specific restriction endonuclease McrA
MKTKLCRKCGVVKFFEQFNKDRRNKTDGLQPRCSACEMIYRQENADKIKKRRELNKEKTKVYKRNYTLNNKEKIALNSAVYRKNNPDKIKINNLKRRVAKRSNGIYKISEKEIQKLYSSNCFYCGSYEKIQIDHVIPISKGGTHSIGNLVPACKDCNLSKRDKFLAEWKANAKIL